MLQAGGQHIAREVERLPGAELHAEELHAGLVELVRLVEDHDAHRRQQLGHARFAHRQVGEEQMMVDDHHVGRQRLAPREVDVAGLELRALRAQAVVAGRRDERDQRRSLVQPGQLGQVAGAGGLGPLLDLGQRAQAAALGRGVVAREVQPMQTQIAGPALEQRGAHRQLERGDQARQVAAEELVLQGLGGGREQHALAAQQRRHQVREGLADTGAGFDDQLAAGFDRARHRHRHLCLAIALAELVGGMRQHAVGRESFAYFLRQRGWLARGRSQRWRGAQERVQIVLLVIAVKGARITDHQAGSCGSTARSTRAIWSRNARRRFLRRRISSSS